MKPWNFLLRSGGSDLRIRRLQERMHLPDGEQLLCALVREDLATVNAIVSSDPGQWLAEFLSTLQAQGLSGLASNYVQRLGLKESFAKAPTPEKLLSSAKESNATENWFETSPLTHLQRMAAIEMSRYDDFDDKFVALLDHLTDLQDRIIWPKGISLSRSLYGEPSNRFSSDFDCILRPDDATVFLKLCSKLGYELIQNDAGFCNQLGVGPCQSLADLFLRPCHQLMPSGVFGLSKDNWPLIDPKFNAFDNGFAFCEFERFFADAEQLNWRKRTFLAPSAIDHLMVCLAHFSKDRFNGWKSLIDIHLLIDRVTQENGWSEFMRRCAVENQQLSAWAGLWVASDRFASAVPPMLLEELTPPKGEASQYFSFTLSSIFYWNQASLPLLLLDARFMGARQRKLKAIADSLRPSTEFLSSYYGGGKPLGWLRRILYNALHSLVLVLPALVVRWTFGQILWPKNRQYSQLPRIYANDSCEPTSEGNRGV